jgi:TonB family protein
MKANSPGQPMDALDTANDRFKRGFASRVWGSMIAATVLHVLIFQLWPDMAVADFSISSDALIAIDLPSEIELPPAPERISRPAMPVVSTSSIDVEATIAPTNFDAFEPAELPPPPSTVASVAKELQPGFTPMTVLPQILNVPEVRRMMEQQYPPILRDARIGGTVRVWFLVNEEGVVEETRIETSSGQQLLDQAALKVASVYRFSPARNRDQIVKVWVAFPVTFRVDP